MGGKIQCPECKKVLHSMYTHDFVICDCPAQTFVDGGDSYIRVGGLQLDELKLIEHSHDGDLTKL